MDRADAGSGVSAKAVSHLHPRYKHMKDMVLVEGIVAEQPSDSLRDKTRLSILSWNAGLKTGIVTPWWAPIT